jgi:superfamily II DNA/RNA helicase
LSVAYSCLSTTANATCADQAAAEVLELQAAFVCLCPTVEVAADCTSSFSVQAQIAAMSGEPARFADMSCISAQTLAVLEAQQFTRATPVQNAVIPLFCGSKDVAVDAATGSGKTLAFIVPIAEKLLSLDSPPKPHEVQPLCALAI